MPPSNWPKSGIPFATPRISSLVEIEVAAEVVRNIAEATNMTTSHLWAGQSAMEKLSLGG